MINRNTKFMKDQNDHETIPLIMAEDQPKQV